MLIPSETNNEILGAFEVLDGFSSMFIAKIGALLGPVSGVPLVLSDEGVAKGLLDLAELSLELLSQMTAITDDYQRISDDRISNLLLIELIVLAYTAIVLSIEIIFVVIPSIRHAVEVYNFGKEPPNTSHTVPKVVHFAESPE
jgi:hypothetical protein